VETSVSEVRSDGAWSGRLLCWVESLILGLGMPAGIWVVSRSILLYIPAAVHGSREQRFLFWILGGVIVEWSFVRALVRVADTEVFFRRPWCLANGDVDRLDTGVADCIFFDCE
jgi:hypothetical protein